VSLARIIACLIGLLGFFSTALAGAAPAVKVDTLLQCQPPVTNRILEHRLDSIGEELSLLVKVLESKGLNLARERAKLARKDSVFQIPVDSSELLGQGPARTGHTLTVFLDLQCPYCSRMAPRLKLLLSQHKDLQVALRHYPLSFHERAMPSARALWAAGKQGKFAEYYWKLVADTANKSLTDSVLIRVAGEAGLDLARFAKDRDALDGLAIVKRDMALAERLGVEGTPSLFLDGKSTQDPEQILSQAK